MGAARGPAALFPSTCAKGAAHDGGSPLPYALRSCITAVAAPPILAPCARDSVSIKLSALHPRYETLQFKHTAKRLCRSEGSRSLRGRWYRYEHRRRRGGPTGMSLQLSERLARNPAAGYEGLGLVVQAYGKRDRRTQRLKHYSRDAAFGHVSSRALLGQRDPASPTSRPDGCGLRAKRHRSRLQVAASACSHAIRACVRSSPRTTRTPSPR